jgi:3-dehydroquinate synthase
MNPMNKTIHVDLGERSYDVTVGPDGMDTLVEVLARLEPTRVIVVTETNVGPNCGALLTHLLDEQGIVPEIVVFEAGEVHKTLDTASMVLDQILTAEPAIDRKAVVVALGGGVAGDIAGFVAAVTLRGLRWVQCPTSLLADVDASVGGKTGVDHASGKNLIGAFHQPSAVCIDVESLRTLPLEHLRNGLAECVKHAVIRDADLLEWIAERADSLTMWDYDDEELAFDATEMTELIARNVAIKAAVVSADEKEAGERAHLNFGHTVGHAFETAIGYEQCLHGQAVSLGMIAANEIAVRRGLLGVACRDRVRAALEALQLPVTLPADVDAAEIWSIMQHDKKNRGGKVRMVLASRIGEVDIYDDITEAEVSAVVNDMKS